jgi:hypothetical protein
MTTPSAPSTSILRKSTGSARWFERRDAGTDVVPPASRRYGWFVGASRGCRDRRGGRAARFRRTPLVDSPDPIQPVVSNVSLENGECRGIGLECDHPRSRIQALEEENRNTDVAAYVDDERVRVLRLEVVVPAQEDLLEHLDQPVVIEVSHVHVEDPRTAETVCLRAVRERLANLEP